MDKIRIDIFQKAFRSPRASCQETCKCGRVFFDFANSWDWEEGEREELEEDPNATALSYSVECVYIDGDEFVMDCNCWYEKAERIMGWIDAHDDQIVEYFKLDKERLEELARAAVVVEVKYDEIKDGWRDIAEAPRNATKLEVLMRNRTTKEAHWAQDLSGEEQPAFRGWFEKSGDGFSQIEDPIAWRYLKNGDS